MSRSLNLKNKDIALRLGISIKTVEKQITKALSGLRNHLKKMDCYPFSSYCFQDSNKK